MDGLVERRCQVQIEPIFDFYGQQNFAFNNFYHY